MNAGLGSIVKAAVEARHVHLGNTVLSIFDTNGSIQSWNKIIDQQAMGRDGTELCPYALPDVPLSLSFSVLVSS